MQFSFAWLTNCSTSSLCPPPEHTCLPSPGSLEIPNAHGAVPHVMGTCWDGCCPGAVACGAVGLLGLLQSCIRRPCGMHSTFILKS